MQVHVTDPVFQVIAMRLQLRDKKGQDQVEARLLFPCELGVSSLVNTDFRYRCVRSPVCLHAVQLAPPAFAFTIFGVLLVFALLFLCCFLAWMRTAILAGGIAVVRSGFCVFC